MTYSTKVDLWIALLVGLAIVIPLVLGARDVLTGQAGEGAIALSAGTFVFLFIALLGYPTTYEITTDSLVVRSGLLFRTTIPLADLKELYPTRNPLSAPAWSLDRLHVGYLRKGKPAYVLISPREKEAFVRDLAAKAGHVRLEGFAGR